MNKIKSIPNSINNNWVNCNKITHGLVNVNIYYPEIERQVRTFYFLEIDLVQEFVDMCKDDDNYIITSIILE